MKYGLYVAWGFISLVLLYIVPFPGVISLILLLLRIKDDRKASKARNQNVRNINMDLDEIESTLDAITGSGQEDGKITPIWGAGTKKDR